MYRTIKQDFLPRVFASKGSLFVTTWHTERDLERSVHSELYTPGRAQTELRLVKGPKMVEKIDERNFGTGEAAGVNIIERPTTHNHGDGVMAKRDDQETVLRDPLSTPTSPGNTSSDNNKDDNKHRINGNTKVSRSKRFKKIACTECRQQKAKCDAHEKAPNSCTRCTKRGIPCRLDSEFKRTFKRAKIDELVKEYEIIKSKLQINPELAGLKDIRNISASPNSHPNGETIPGYNISSTSHTPNLSFGLTTAPSPLNTQSQFLPPLQSLQRASSYRNNGFKSTSNGAQLPDPNIFHPATGNNSITNAPSAVQATHPSLRRSSTLPLNRSSTTLATANRAQYSPLSVMNKPQSPLNPDLNVSSILSQIPLSNPYVQSLSSATTPKFDNLGSNSRISSSYNLTTLISAANASNKNDPPVHLGPSVCSSNNESSNYLNWKVQNYAVEKPQVTPSMLECTPKTLGEMTLTEEEIVVLFTTFLTYYHPFLPIIDVNKGIERIYRLCPVLFWTIMLTALRGHHKLSPVISQSECQSLYFTLSPILKSVLAEITISPITRYTPTEVEEPILNASSVYSVQAFLIYTFWPPLISSLSADSTWNTAGIAVYQAIRIGLHSPGHTSDSLKSTNKDLIAEQIRTWIGCNIVSQTIGTVFGFPAFFQPFSSLSLTGIEIPKTLKQMLEIQTFEEQVEKTLNNNAFDPLRLKHASERLPMIQLLESELNQLELRLSADIQNPMDDFRLLLLYAARLHLFSYNFLDNEQIASFELKRGYIKTYNASLALLQHCKESQSRDDTFVNNLPSACILSIWQASVIIARLVNSCYKDVLDVGAGKELYQSAIALVMKASVMKHDLSYRSCGIMKSTWNLFRTLDEDKSGALKVSVKSRMSASIFFDSLWILREKCGMIKLRPTKEKTSASESLESDSEVEVIDEESTEQEKANNKTTKDLIEENKEKRSLSRDSTSSSKKKSMYHPESAARRIISTIPLDPQPIAIAETPQDSTSSSKQSSPFLTTYKSPTNNESSIKKIITPQSLANVATSQYHSSPESHGKDTASNGSKTQGQTNNARLHDTPRSSQDITAIAPSGTAEMLEKEQSKAEAGNAASSFLLDSWDVGNEFDSAMLFKDIESVMDEFGFHADY